MLRFLIKLQKIWNDFVEGWNKTMGPLVDATTELLDDLTGGVLSEFETAVKELLNALETIGVQELSTFARHLGRDEHRRREGWSARTRSCGAT